MIKFEIKDIIAIWGAITGTVGMIMAIYLWKLKKRALTPAIKFLRVKLKILESWDKGIHLHFDSVISNQSNVPSTIERFEINFGKKLNKNLETWVKSNYPSKFLHLNHFTKIGTIGTPIEKHKDETFPDYNKPLTVQPNGIIDTLHLNGKFYIKKDVNIKFVRLLKKRVRIGNFRIVAYLANGSNVYYCGKWSIM